MQIMFREALAHFRNDFCALGRMFWEMLTLIATYSIFNEEAVDVYSQE